VWVIVAKEGASYCRQLLFLICVGHYLSNHLGNAQNRYLPSINQAKLYFEKSGLGISMD
jgi:hypothetical protein